MTFAPGLVARNSGKVSMQGSSETASMRHRDTVRIQSVLSKLPWSYMTRFANTE